MNKIFHLLLFLVFIGLNSGTIAQNFKMKGDTVSGSSGGTVYLPIRGYHFVNLFDFQGT